jgi:hypothetical protein
MLFVRGQMDHKILKRNVLVTESTTKIKRSSVRIAFLMHLKVFLDY